MRPAHRAIVIAVAGALVGIAAEAASYDWDEAARWFPDLAVGWTFIVCGLIAIRARPESRTTGTLMVATGFTWFLGNFMSHEGIVGWLSANGLYVYRGPLIHCVLSFPTGRVQTRLDKAAVVVGYITAAIAALARSEIVTIALGAFLIAVAARAYEKTIGSTRRVGATTLRATTAVGAVLAGGAMARLLLPVGAEDALRFLFEAALCAIAVGLVMSLIRAPWERTQVADLVVELAEAPTETLRDALARALGDPTIEVGYVVPGTDRYVDARGHPIDVPRGTAGRTVTPIELDGRRIGVLVHDPAVLDDPGLMDSIASAARLAASNARLQMEVRAQLGEVRASRRRLVVAGDNERRRLERRLREGAERRLDAIGSGLLEARTLAEEQGAGGTLELVEQAERQLRHTLEDLHELARGLHPAALQELGLSGALADLTERSPIPITLHVSTDVVPLDAAAGVYFLCSEALTNVAKYAGASSGSITVQGRDGSMTVEVVDDGVGGADVESGSGLRGLTDRIEALGGRLTVSSAPGRGTRLIAEIPIGVGDQSRR